MPEEGSTTTTETVKKISDGTVNIAVEKYNELLETIAKHNGTINQLNDQLHKLRSEPPVINRTVVHKTAEILAQEHRVWGGSLMGLGAAFFAVGAFRYRAGTS